MWIPGYWFWDEDRDDYVWVSGVWRRSPPDRRWVPGYWQAGDGGYQWIAGFWGPVAADTVEYLDAPPASLDSGPSGPAPSDSTFWMPGNWEFHVNAYRWRPGHWHPFQSDWAWVTAQYIWTPRGYVYIPGYWDYSLARRGFLFAPVYFRAPIYERAGFCYRPTYWIGSDALLVHLFVLPGCHHLYFGDYYAPRYRQRNYIPCYDYHARHRGYASLYMYYEHHFRQRGIDYCGRVRQWHEYYARNADVRPAHTYGLQIDRDRHDLPRSRASAELVVRPYDVLRSNAGTDHRLGGQHLVQVASHERERVRLESNQSRKLATERRKFEIEPVISPPNGGAPQGKTARQHGKFKLPDTPSVNPRHQPLVTRPDSPGRMNALRGPNKLHLSESGASSESPRDGISANGGKRGRLPGESLPAGPARARDRVTDLQRQLDAVRAAGAFREEAKSATRPARTRLPLASGATAAGGLSDAGGASNAGPAETGAGSNFEPRVRHGSSLPPARITQGEPHLKRSQTRATPPAAGFPTVRGQTPDAPRADAGPRGLSTLRSKLPRSFQPAGKAREVRGGVDRGAARGAQSQPHLPPPAAGSPATGPRGGQGAKGEPGGAGGAGGRKAFSSRHGGGSSQ